MRDWSSITVIAVMGVGVAIATATAFAAGPDATTPAVPPAISIASLPTEGQAPSPRQAEADHQVYRAPVRDDEQPTPGNRIALRLRLGPVGITGDFVQRSAEAGEIAGRQGLSADLSGPGPVANASAGRMATPILFVPF